MKNKCKILGVNFDNVTKEQALNKLLFFLKNNKTNMVFTANPEFVMAAQKDKQFLDILNKGQLVVADGIGIVIASKLFFDVKIKERVAGYDLVQSLFDKIKNTGEKVYFLGGTESSVQKAKKEMEKKYNGINIVGVHNGYFDEKEERIIIEQIKSLKADIVLVGIGFPKQEKWIYNHKDEIGAKIYIGVGGSFDVMSGNVKRAPKFFINCGLEWFYRLITQPTRFIRMLQLPLFMIFVLKSKIKR